MRAGQHTDCNLPENDRQPTPLSRRRHFQQHNENARQIKLHERLPAVPLLGWKEHIIMTSFKRKHTKLSDDCQCLIVFADECNERVARGNEGADVCGEIRVGV
jgi:hypothetical protein